MNSLMQALILATLLVDMSPGVAQLPSSQDQGTTSNVSRLLDDGRYLDAISLTQRSLTAQENSSAADLAKTLIRLGTALSSCDRDAEAKAMLERAIEVQSKIEPRDNRGLASNLAKLGRALIGIGDFAAAELRIRSAIGMLEEQKDDESKEYAEALAALGSLELARARYKEAQSEIERSLAIRRRIGDESEVAYSLIQMGAIFGEQQESEKEAEVVREANAIINKRFGPGHPANIYLLVRLTWGLLNRHEAAQAKVNIDRQIRLAEDACGPESPLILSALMQRAQLHLILREFLDARADASHAVQIQESSVGPTSPRLAAWLRMEGDILRESGDFSAAEISLRRSIELARGQGLEVLAAASMTSLGKILFGQQRLAEAGPLLEKSQAILDSELGTDTYISLDNLQLLAAIHLDEKHDVSSAISLLERALPLARKAYGPDNPLVINMLRQLVPILQGSGNVWRAEALGEELVRLVEKKSGPVNAELAMPLQLLSSIEQAKGDFGRARTLLDRALGLLQTRFGDAHPATATARVELAGLMEAQGDFVGASDLYESAANLLQSYRGADDPSVGLALAGAASATAQYGQYERAAPLFDRAIASLEHHPGDPNLVVVLANRAELYSIQGQPSKADETYIRAAQSLGENSPYPILAASIVAGRAVAVADMGRIAEAESLFRYAIQSVERSGGELSTSLPEILQSYGRLLVEQAKYDDASAAFERALLIIQKTKGASHPAAGRSLVGRGSVQEAKGDFTGAQASYEEALSLWTKTLSPGHLAIADALYHLGQLAERRGDLKGADESLQRALAIRKRILGPKHPDIAQCLLVLAQVRLDAGQYSESRVLAEETLEITIATYGPSDQRVAAALNSAALVLGAQGLYSESAKLLEEAKVILESYGENNSAKYATILNNLGSQLFEMGRYSEARSALERGLALRKERLGPGHPDVAASLQSLAQLRAAVGDFSGSRQACEAAIALYSKTKGLSAENLAHAQLALAQILSRQGEYLQARRLGQDSLETLRQSLGEKNAVYGEALRGFASVVASQGDTSAAYNIYREALSVTEGVLGPQHPKIGLILMEMGSAAECKGDLRAARAMLERAKTILEATLGEKHILVGRVLELLGQLRSGQGDVESGEALKSQAAEIIKDQLGVEHPALASIFSSLAIDRSFLKMPVESSELLEKAVKIEERLARDNDPASVGMLCHIGSAQAVTSQHMAARASYDRALTVLDSLGRGAGVEALGVLMGRGRVSFDTGDTVGARLFNERALRIAEKYLEPTDARLALIIGDLGLLDWHDGKTALAREKLLKSAEMLRAGTESLVTSLSFAEQRAFLGTLIGYPAPFIFSYLSEGEQLAKGYESIFSLKGLLVESLRREASVAMIAARDPGKSPLVDRLHELRTEIGGLHASEAFGNNKTRLRDLSGEKERLEARLLRLVPAGGLKDAAAGMNLRKVRRLLEDDEVIVDIYRYQDLLGGNPVDQYSAVVITAQQNPSIVVHMGSVERVHSAIDYWRSLVLSGASSDVIDAAWGSLVVLLWQPISAQLPISAKRIWLSPDDELSRVPWQLFPTTGTRFGSRLVTQVDSVREFLRLKTTASRVNERKAVLAIGGIDFNSGSGETLEEFSPLPGSAKEVESVKTIASRQGFQVDILRGGEAGKTEVLRSLPHANYIHIATHGFFSKSSPTMSTSELFEGGLREPWMELVGKTRNPLAESGLVLAGANRRPSIPEESRGLLTAEELIGVDLSQARLVTLSACETGRGEEATGQGVLGLRSAFLAAGAQSLVMSLWKVSDEATRALMEKFYQNLWERRLKPLAALIDAQRALRTSPIPELSAPASWAGWVLVGNGW